MNVFDTKHNYAVQESLQESLYSIAALPLPFSKVTWIFKDQDYQHSCLSEKALISPLPPPPKPPLNVFFFSYLSEIS